MKTFNTPVVGIIYFSEDFADAKSKDVFVINNPDHKFTNVIVQIYQKMTEG